MRFAAILGVLGLLVSLAPAQRKGTSDWLSLLADYPSLGVAQRAALLARLPKFYAEIDDVDMDRDDGLPSFLALQRLNLRKNQPLAAAMRKTFLGPSLIEGDHESPSFEMVDMRVSLGINILEMGLVDFDGSVQAAARKSLEDLLLLCFTPKKIQILRRRGEWTTQSDFKIQVNNSYRRYAAKDSAWFSELATKPKMLRPFTVHRAELKDESLRKELKTLSESKSEMDLTIFAESVLQWPDPEFLPYLEQILLREKGAVVASIPLQFALIAYKEKAAAVVRRVNPSLSAALQAHFIEIIATLPFGTSWDLLVESLNSPSAQIRITAIKGLFGYRNPYLLYGPPEGLPVNITELTHDYAAQYIFDTNEDVRVAAVEALDYNRVKSGTWRRIAGDVSPKVRIAVVPFIAKLEAELALDLLWTLIIDRDPAVRSEAAEQKVAGLSLKALRETKSTNAVNRAAAATVLGSYGASAYLEDVVPLLKDRSPMVQEAATIALLGFNGGFELIAPEIRQLTESGVTSLCNRIAEMFSPSEAIRKLRFLSPLVSLPMRQQIEDLCQKLKKLDPYDHS